MVNVSCFTNKKKICRNSAFKASYSDCHKYCIAIDNIWFITVTVLDSKGYAIRKQELLGASAGIKHFGTRRLGRSGLAVRPPTGTDNVWDVDCSSFFPPDVNTWLIHGAYFYHDGTLALMRQVLRGIDRDVLDATGALEGDLWPKPV